MPKRPVGNKSKEKLSKKQFAKYLSDISDGQYHPYEFLDFFKILEAGLFQLVKENKEAEIAGLCTFYTKDNPSKEWTDPFTGRAIVTEGSSTLGVKVSQYFQLDTKEAVKIDRKRSEDT